MTTREFKQFIFDSSVAGLTNAVDESPVFPVGQKWQIKRVIFADPGIGDNISAGFQLQWGSPGSGYEFINGAYLTGDTREIVINRIFVGDGDKRFRVVRQNNSAAAKKVTTFIEAIRREGD